MAARDRGAGPKRIVGEAEIFVAYPYRHDNAGYRVLLSGLEQEYAAKFRYADDTPTATHLTQKVRMRIDKCSVSILDLSE